MVYYRQYLDLDFDVPRGTVKILRIKQGDKYSPILAVRLYRNGDPYILSDGNSIYLRCEKANGSTAEISPYNLNENTALFSINNTATDVAGRCICDVCINDDGDILSSESFLMFVHHSPGYT